jgi:predicted RNA binding protein YcfA (HicA-like mRNA interferase family)
MGSRLPSISGRSAVQAFCRLGWSVARQASSHIILTKSGQVVTLSIPNHKEVAKGTLRSLIRAANLTVEEFVASMQRR